MPDDIAFAETLTTDERLAELAAILPAPSRAPTRGKRTTIFRSTETVRWTVSPSDAAVIDQLRAVFRQPEIVARAWKAARAMLAGGIGAAA